MTCLHFRIDRATGVCQTCGATIVAALPPALDADRQGVLEAAFPAAPLPAALPEPQADDVHDFLAQLKAAAKGPAEPAAPPLEEPAPVDRGPGSPWDRERQDALPLAEARPEPYVLPASVVVAGGALALAEPATPEAEDLDDDYDRSAGPPDEPLFHAILGTAGTGKTYQARRRADQYSDALLCATTGIAAVNIGGVTINSLLGYADTESMRVDYEVGKLGAFLRRLLGSGYYRLVIDEISMMDGHQLDVLTAAVDDINNWQREQGRRELGLTLVGDFAQLPPVKAPFVFQRPSWTRFEDHITLLTHPHRQADPAFVSALQAVRRGDRRAAMDYFGGRIVQGEEREYDGSTILAKNDEVDRYNRLRLLNLPGAEDRFVATRWVKTDGKEPGREPAEWRKNIPDVLTLKRGALVMILANRRVPGDPSDNPEMLYANGSLATYLEPAAEWTGGNPLVQGYPAKTDYRYNQYQGSYTMAKVRLKDNGREVLVPMSLREKGKPTGRSGKKLARTEVEASIEYMPLRVAYATTCHKSQGLSLDNVQIMFHSRFWTLPGMLYVALSRARTAQGLRLVGTPGQFEQRINTDPNIRKWL